MASPHVSNEIEFSRSNNSNENEEETSPTSPLVATSYLSPSRNSLCPYTSETLSIPSSSLQGLITTAATTDATATLAPTTTTGLGETDSVTTTVVVVEEQPSTNSTYRIESTAAKVNVQDHDNNQENVESTTTTTTLEVVLENQTAQTPHTNSNDTVEDEDDNWAIWRQLREDLALLLQLDERFRELQNDSSDPARELGELFRQLHNINTEPSVMIIRGVLMHWTLEMQRGGLLREEYNMNDPVHMSQRLEDCLREIQNVFKNKVREHAESFRRLHSIDNQQNVILLRGVHEHLTLVLQRHDLLHQVYNSNDSVHVSQRREGRVGEAYDVNDVDTNEAFLWRALLNLDTDYKVERLRLWDDTLAELRDIVNVWAVASQRFAQLREETVNIVNIYGGGGNSDDANDDNDSNHEYNNNDNNTSIFLLRPAKLPQTTPNQVAAKAA
ncbi:hypothetical protein ACA910_005499 [Epithemia clementina (nom. ined.)]